MKAAAKNLEFEKAALLRDQIIDLRREMLGGDADESLTTIADLILERRRRAAPAQTGARPPATAEGRRGGGRARPRYRA